MIWKSRGPHQKEASLNGHHCVFNRIPEAMCYRNFFACFVTEQRQKLSAFDCTYFRMYLFLTL